uniref:NEMP family n=1 Tax=Siphoviridae sp. ctsUY14 TaxID=2825693 RepID=A0A8S5P5P2_9CAUD|nr:MAG TPA: NEMP family [Siphoviridae sp. ctsUY14]
MPMFVYTYKLSTIVRFWKCSSPKRFHRFVNGSLWLTPA